MLIGAYAVIKKGMDFITSSWDVNNMKDNKVITFPLKEGDGCRRSTFMEIADRLQFDADYLDRQDKTALGVSDVSGNLRALAEWLRGLA